MFDNSEYWIEEFYRKRSLLRHISFTYEVLEKHKFIFETLNTILGFCDLKLTKKDKKYYIKPFKRTTLRVNYWGLYQTCTYYSSICVEYPKVNCVILLDNRNKEIYICNIKQFNEGRLLNKLIENQISFKDVSSHFFRFVRSSKTKNIDTTGLISV